METASWTGCVYRSFWTRSDERKLVVLRYFQDKTQGQTGQILGMSQVQVSRLEKKILGRLRWKILE